MAAQSSSGTDSLGGARLRELLLVVLLNLAAMGVLAWRLRDPRLGAVRIEPPPTASPAPSATPVRLHVHVSGAVRRPGVVVLGEGARSAEAIRAAGGFSAAADRAGLNLAAPLGDGMQLHVPREGESPRPVAGPQASRPGAPAQGSASGAGAAASSSAAGVNVNRAAAVQLEALPGVGPALAARIVAHREAHGPFGSPEDLLAVSGIGPKTLERMRAQVVVR